MPKREQPGKRPAGRDSRRDLLREQKILRAKGKLGELDAGDAERLEELDAALAQPPPLPRRRRESRHDRLDPPDLSAGDEEDEAAAEDEQATVIQSAPVATERERTEPTGGERDATDPGGVRDAPDPSGDRAPQTTPSVMIDASLAAEPDTDPGDSDHGEAAHPGPAGEPDPTSPPQFAAEDDDRSGAALDDLTGVERFEQPVEERTTASLDDAAGFERFEQPDEQRAPASLDDVSGVERFEQPDAEAEKPAPASLDDVSGVERFEDLERERAPAAAAGPKPVDFSEEALFTESVVISRSAVTGARPVSLDAAAAEGQPNDLSGPRSVVVQLLDGLSHSGKLERVELAADTVLLQQPRGSDEPVRELPIGRIRSIQVMLPRRLRKPEAAGQVVTVHFKDGRPLSGRSPDRDQNLPAFTVFPEEERFIERVVVYRHAVKETD
jgi:hypothetical protein